MDTTPTAINPNPFFNSEEAGQYLNRDPRTMANDRSLGLGPRYTKFGRLIRYHRSDLDAYADENMVEPGA